MVVMYLGFNSSTNSHVAPIFTKFQGSTAQAFPKEYNIYIIYDIYIYTKFLTDRIWTNYFLLITSIQDFFADP